MLIKSDSSVLRLTRLWSRVEIGNISPQLQSFNKDNGRAKRMGGDEG